MVEHCVTGVKLSVTSRALSVLSQTLTSLVCGAAMNQGTASFSEIVKQQFMLHDDPGSLA